MPAEPISVRPSVRYHSLDLWRGVACLLVIVFHSTLYVPNAIVARLWVGVPMFFVISGYCIAAAADGRYATRAATSDYFRRRFRRIYPPLWVCLALSALFIVGAEHAWPGLVTDSSHPIDSPHSLSGWHIVGNLTLTESWRHWVVGDEAQYLVGHVWTLCYEEQFYAVVGLALVLAPRRIWPILCGVTIAVLGGVVLRLFGYGTLQGFFFDGLWLDFAAGLGVFWCLNHGGPASRRVLACLLLAGIGLQFVRFHRVICTEASFEQFRIASFSFALLLLALHRWDRQIAGHLWAKPFAWCGLLCYSIYLVHWPICKALSHGLYLSGFESTADTLLVTVPGCIAASVAAGLFFHRTVEHRFLNPPRLAG